MHSQSSGSSSTFRERLSNLRRNGTPEIVIGFAILAVAGIDYALQARTDRQKEDMYNQLEREVKEDEAASRKEDRELIQKGTATPKFQCVVRKVPPYFDGHKCLKDLQEGDVVGVIEEGVGPGGMYNLCSIQRRNAENARKGSSGENGVALSIGWFPTQCLQKIEETSGTDGDE